VAHWSEVCALVGEMGKMNTGVFEIAQEPLRPTEFMSGLTS
jgi:hypothetical protein